MITWRRTAVCLLLVMWMSANGCGKKEVEQVEVIRPVVTMLVPAAGTGRERAFSGTARSALETLLSFRVAGEIIELPIKVGQQVKVGDLIARLDTTDHDLQVKQLEAQLAQAEAQLEQAKSEYERSRQLYEARNVSKSELDSQQAYYKSTLAQRDATLKGLELARQQREYCTLRAPVAGSIASIPVEKHQTVQAGGAIATLSAGGEVEVVIGIPEVLIARVGVGDPATVRFEAVPEKTFDANVSEVGIELSSSSTYPVTLTLEEKDERIRAGMIGEATLVFEETTPDAIYIPGVAVVGAPSGEKYVWVVDEQTMRAEKRVVQVGDLTSEGLQILSGLRSGERLIIRGVHRVHDGMKVRLLED